MRKLFFLTLFVGTSILSYAQGVNSISQNFDGVCATSAGFPFSWQRYNPVAGTAANGQWVCDPPNGRKNGSGSPTPGVSCTGVWGGAYNLDTSFLITPLLNFTGHDHAFLYFDAKADSVTLGGGFKLLVYRPDSPYVFSDTAVHVDVSDSLAPLITVADSGTWVTHVVDLTRYINMPPSNFYVAFMYTSSATSGSKWFIDNVNTTFYRLDVPVVTPEQLPIAVRGLSSPSNITLSFGNVIQGAWQLSIYDMMGRQVYGKTVSQPGYVDTYTITDAGLAPGLYVVRMTNGGSYGATKLSVQ